jgi:hypothetical protein
MLPSAPLGAQWLTYRTPGHPAWPTASRISPAPEPRTREGKQDLSGLWRRIDSEYAENIAADLKPLGLLRAGTALA